MLEARAKAIEELANWCRNQRQNALNGIQFFAERRKYIATFDPELANGPIVDGLRDQIAGLRQTILDMDRLLIDIETDYAERAQAS